MKIYNSPGTKERLIEMMQGVNKISLNEIDVMSGNSIPKDELLSLEQEFEPRIKIIQLIKAPLSGYVGKIKIDDKVYEFDVMYDLGEWEYFIVGYPTKDTFEDNYGRVGYKGNIDDLKQDLFSSDTIENESYDQINEDVNDSNRNKIIDYYSYLVRDLDVRKNPELKKKLHKYLLFDRDDFNMLSNEELQYIWDVVKNVDDQASNNNESYDQNCDPFGGSEQEMQDGSGYVDEKPVNTEIRVKSDQLAKYIKESFVDVQSPLEKLSREDIRLIIQAHNNLTKGKGKPEYAPTSTEIQQEFNKLKGINEGDGGETENVLKNKFRVLNSDLDFSRLSDVYKNLLGLKHGEFRNKGIIKQSIEDVKQALVDYLNNIGGLNVSGQDVQKFYQEMISDFSPQIRENNDEIENSEDDNVPALDVNDVDNDGEQLEGGLGDNTSITMYDPEQILKGIGVEMEHTKDPDVALEISQDHLAELPQYYDSLEKMERGCDICPDEQNPIDNNQEDELETDLLGITTQTPNKVNEYDDTQSKYNKYQQIGWDNLNDQEKEEYYELWLQFKER
jgi:hypothetical protein